MSCKMSDKELEGMSENYVDYIEFNAFKTSILGEISKSKEEDRISKGALAERYQKLEEESTVFSDHLLALKNKQQDKYASIVKLEKDVAVISEQNKSLSKLIEKNVSIKKKKKKTAKALNRFPFSFSSIAVWGDHYVVYMKEKGKHFPLRINDMLGDWRLVGIDYDVGRVVFKHSRTKKTIERKLP